MSWEASAKEADLSKICVGASFVCKYLLERCLRGSLSTLFQQTFEIIVKATRLRLRVRSEKGILGRMGRILGRFGTDVGTDKTCKIPNVYRAWDGGTDKLGGGEGVTSQNQAPKTSETLTAVVLRTGSHRENLCFLNWQVVVCSVRSQIGIESFNNDRRQKDRTSFPRRLGTQIPQGLGYARFPG
jgi:hypothetical protein